jgi:hypothetical protein
LEGIERFAVPGSNEAASWLLAALCSYIDVFV